MPLKKHIAFARNHSSIHWVNVSIITLLLIFGVSFATSNMHPVHIAILNIVTQPMPLYLPILIAFFMGVVGGMLSLFFSRRKDKYAIAQLKKDNLLLQQEVENLRNIPLQDDV